MRRRLWRRRRLRRMRRRLWRRRRLGRRRTWFRRGRRLRCHRTSAVQQQKRAQEHAEHHTGRHALCARHVSDCPCNSSARRRTFTDTLQRREQPAERSTSAPMQDRHGAGPSNSPAAQLATALLRRSTSAPASRHQITPFSAPRCAASPRPRAGATRRELRGATGAGRAAPHPARAPRAGRTCTPAQPARR